MRLIDADALEYTRVRIFHGLNEDGTPCVGGWNAVLMSSTIKDAHTVDAVPVVHGRWLSWKELLPNQFSLLRFVKKKGFCSNCGAFERKDRFCPFCGAKMDGGNEE